MIVSTNYLVIAFFGSIILMFFVGFLTGLYIHNGGLSHISLSQLWMRDFQKSSPINETSLMSMSQQDHVEKNTKYDEEIDDEEDENDSKGARQIRIDVKNVSSDFLRSEEHLVQAVTNIASFSGWNLLSHRHHDWNGQKITLTAFCLDSYMIIHTWPKQNCLSFDLFHSGSVDIISMIPFIKSHLSGPSNSDEHSVIQWSYKRRGFGSSRAFDNIDLNSYYLGPMEPWKERIASVESKFQTIDIYNIMRHKIRKDLTESQNKFNVQRDKIVFLDGVVQSSRNGDAAYHEALVHPALQNHPCPRRVAIIGGGEGATLREVLKYQSVESVTMVEIDQTMVEVSRIYLPEWNDCSMLAGDFENCFDDPRVELQISDAGAWFIDRFSEQRIDPSMKFDVVIMDSLDPLNDNDFCDGLFSSDVFVSSIFNSLNTDGVFVSQIGQADSLDSFPDHLTLEVNFVQKVSGVGFHKVRKYTEAHGGFDAPWTFLIALKTFHANDLWFGNQAEFDYRSHLRAINTKDGILPFRYFDGATMMTYQYPDSIMETLFCMSQPQPFVCSLASNFDSKLHFRHILFKQNNLMSFVIMPSTTDLIHSMSYQNFSDNFNHLDAFQTTMEPKVFEHSKTIAIKTDETLHMNRYLDSIMNENGTIFTFVQSTRNGFLQEEFSIIKEDNLVYSPPYDRYDFKLLGHFET